MTIHGPSMAPGLSPNYNAYGEMDRVWAKMWEPTEGLQRGMLIAFWSPQDPEKEVVKRIVAVEGDTVRTRPPYPFPTAEVPVGCVWVEGDDRSRSIDSNDYGPIAISLIVAQITHVVWPWSRMGRVRWEDWPRNKNLVQK
ncbi:MAG: hypothetical protein M1833_000168 [Piccolia ochrophora]|nr:MAG: hypothetical protein M1833_000168 [Piccolia ochrophora]